MTIHVLLSGELHRDPTPRTSQTGKQFTTANLKVQSDGETVWASIICFTDEGQQELLRLRAGDAIAAQGRLKISTYERNGEVRPSLDITAGSILPLRPKPRTRQPRQGGTDSRQYDPRSLHGHGAPAHQPDPDFDDPIPFG